VKVAAVFKQKMWDR